MMSTKRFGVGRLTAFAQRSIPYTTDNNTLVFDTRTQYYRYILILQVRVKTGISLDKIKHSQKYTAIDSEDAMVSLSSCPFTSSIISPCGFF